MRSLPILLLLSFLLSACVGEDFLEDYVQPQLQLRSLPDTLEAGTSFQLSFQYFNNIGQAEEVKPVWTSSDPEVLTLSATGMATGHQEGRAELTATYTDPEFAETASVSQSLIVGASTVVVDPPVAKKGSVKTTSTYKLSGDFDLAEQEDGSLLLSFDDAYTADRALPGLYVYLSNNPRSSRDAYEIGKVTVFDGAHQYRIADVSIEDYAYVLYFCKPFNVEVGNGAIGE